jgi:hypothetical protein
MSYPQMPAILGPRIKPMQAHFFRKDGVEYVEIAIPLSADKLVREARDSDRETFAEAYSAFRDQVNADA